MNKTYLLIIIIILSISFINISFSMDSSSSSSSSSNLRSNLYNPTFNEDKLSPPKTGPCGIHFFILNNHIYLENEEREEIYAQTFEFWEILESFWRVLINREELEIENYWMTLNNNILRMRNIKLENTFKEKEIIEWDITLAELGIRSVIIRNENNLRHQLMIRIQTQQLHELQLQIFNLPLEEEINRNLILQQYHQLHELQLQIFNLPLEEEINRNLILQQYHQLHQFHELQLQIFNLSQEEEINRNLILQQYHQYHQFHELQLQIFNLPLEEEINRNLILQEQEIDFTHFPTITNHRETQSCRCCIIQ